jgi:hypothetical protein
MNLKDKRLLRPHVICVAERSVSVPLILFNETTPLPETGSRTGGQLVEGCQQEQRRSMNGSISVRGIEENLATISWAESHS